MNRNQSFTLRRGFGRWLTALSIFPALGPFPAPVPFKGSIAGDPASLCVGPAPNGYQELRFSFDGEAPACELPVAPGPDGRFEFTARPGGLLRAGLAGGAAFRINLAEETRSLSRLAPGPSAELFVQVIDERGRPVRGARVITEKIQNSPVPAPWRPEPRGASTDAAGQASLPVWPGEELQLAVVAPGFLPKQTFPLKPIAGALLTLELEKGQVRTVEVLDRNSRPLAGTLVSARWLTLGSTDENGRLEVVLDENVPLSFHHREDGTWKVYEPVWRDGLLQVFSRDRQLAGGRIAGPDGEPAGGARIQAWSLSGDFVEVRSGPDGNFSFGPLDRSIYRLRGILPGHADALGELRISPAGGPPPAIELRLGGQSASLAGKVLDELGAPLGGAKIRLFRPGRIHQESAPADATTAADGSYRVGGLLPGEDIHLQADFPGRLAGQLRQLRADGTGGHDFRLEPEATLDILVTDGDAAPLEGALVLLASLKNPEMIRGERTGDDGRLRLTGLAAGSYLLRVRAEGYLPEGRETTLAGARREAVTLGRGASLEGLFLDLAGKPVAGAVVRVQNPEQPGCCWGRTDDEGRYRLTGIGKGDWRLEAIQEGRVPLIGELEVTRLAAYERDLQLAEGEKLHGVVRDSLGNPLAGARVAVFDRSRPDLDDIMNAEDFARVWTATWTDGEGRFTLHHLGRHHYSLSVSAEDHVRIRHEVDIAGPNTFAEIVLPPYPATGSKQTVAID